MRWLIPLLLATAGAALDRAPAAAQLPGTYVLTRVQEQALPAASPDEDGVVVVAAFLELRDDERYAFGMLANVGAESRFENRQAAGRYQVRGDTVVLHPDSAAGEVRWTFGRDGETLTIRDEHAHAFVFATQPAPPAPPRPGDVPGPASVAPTRGTGGTE